jgi:nucleoside 2-deoxyribosyltransferase
MTTALPSVYIAGPDLFFPNYDAFKSRVTLVCNHYGLLPIFPADAPGKPPKEIFRGNIFKLRNADAVVANVQAFRSPTEPDSGTAYEVGGAYLLGKPVAMWLTPEQNIPHARRIENTIGSRVENGALIDNLWGHLVEDFDSPVNLMLSSSGPIFSSVEEALLDVAVKLRSLLAGE